MGKPTVSVIIPCYNGERWISDAIHSVKTQTYQNIETIVINDCSTDGSIEEIQKWKNITLINLEENAGVCTAATIGFRVAKTDYACILAADDFYVDPKHISSQVREMEKYNLDWCYSNCSLRGESIQTAKISKTAWLSPPIRNTAKYFMYLDNFILMFPKICYLLSGIRNPVNCSSMMIRMSSYRDKRLSWQPWGLKSVCDGGLIATMFLSNMKCRAIRNCAAFYRIHGDQISNKPINNEAMKRLIEKMYGEEIMENQPYWMKICARIIKENLVGGER